MNAYSILLLGIWLCYACQGQKPANVQLPVQEQIRDSVAQIDGEVRGIWQDRKGYMWFASNGNGCANTMERLLSGMQQMT